MATNLEEAAEELTEKVVDESSNKVVIDEDADDDREVVQAEDKDRLSRRDRRRKRYEEMLDKQYERGRAEADARIKALEAQIQALANQRQAPHREEEEDEIPPQVREVDEQLRLIVSNISRLPNTEDGRRQEAELEAKYRKLEFKKSKIISELHSGGRREPDDVEFGRRLLRLEFPQVYGNDLARAQANQEMQDLIRAGHPENIETARLAAKNALSRIGLGAKASPHKPSDGVKAKYASTPAQAGDSGGPRTVALDRAQMQMAKAYAKGRTSDDREAAEIFVREILRPNGLV